MALENAEITVQFTAQWTGDHRVCYRVVGDPTYICTIPGSPSGNPGINTDCAAGNTCQYNIPIQVDNETCDQVNYEGYVQAFCEDVESLAGRIPFVISFIPDPTCKRYEVTCDNVPVAGATVNDGGTGYVDGSYTNVGVVGGGGTNAEFTVNIAGGIIQSPLILTTPGSGYTSVPTLDLVGAGIVTAGTVAIITVNLDNCANDLRVYDCSNNFTTVPGGTIALGESIFECYGVGTPPEVVTGFIRSEQDGNCLCNCVEITFETPLNDSYNYSYIDCNGITITSVAPVTAGGSAAGPFCAVSGSYLTFPTGLAVPVVTEGADCDAV
jgi:hypothetical protein